MEEQFKEEMKELSDNDRNHIDEEVHGLRSYRLNQVPHDLKSSFIELQKSIDIIIILDDNKNMNNPFAKKYIGYRRCLQFAQPPPQQNNNNTDYERAASSEPSSTTSGLLWVCTRDLGMTNI